GPHPDFGMALVDVLVQSAVRGVGAEQCSLARDVLPKLGGQRRAAPVLATQKLDERPFEKAYFQRVHPLVLDELGVSQLLDFLPVFVLCTQGLSEWRAVAH